MPSTLFTPLALAILAILAVAIAKALPKIRRRPDLPFKPATLMTPNELHFHSLLESALPDPRWRAWPQVAMLALVEPDRPKGAKEFWPAFNKVASKRVDWVVACDLDPIVVVELDDSTHDSLKDRLRDEILLQANLPVLRFDSRAKPNRQALRAALVNSARGRVSADTLSVAAARSGTINGRRIPPQPP